MDNIEEKEIAKAIINYFELYNDCKEENVNEETQKKFDKLLKDVQDGKINLDENHQQLVYELGTHVSYISQIGDKEYIPTYENIKENFGIGNEDKTQYADMISTNDETSAYYKLLSEVPTIEFAEKLQELKKEEVKKF